MSKEKNLREHRPRRGTSLALKLAVALTGVILVFMLGFALFLRVFLQDAVKEQIQNTALEAAKTAATADVEAWTQYFATPYQGKTFDEIQAVVDSMTPREYEQSFLNEEQKRIRERNLTRFNRFGLSEGQILAVELFPDVAGGLAPLASYSGEMRWAPGRGLLQEFPGGATIDEGDLTIGGITSRVIRGSHPVQNRHGEDVGVLAVYINTKAIDETTDALMFWVLVAAGFFILLGTGVALLLGRQITKPLKQLQDDIRIVAGGDLDHHTTPHSTDEIGDLARTFDGPTRSLREARDAEREAAKSRKELSVAADVTGHLFPETLPKIPGFDLAAHHESADQLSSEYYDVISMGGGRQGLLVASASGTGVPAALVLGMARSFITVEAKNRTDPGEVLREVNSLLSGDLRRGMYVTALLAVVDPKAATLSIANAGHPALLVTKDEGKKVDEIHSEGIALGFDEGPVFNETLVVRSIEMAPGDRVTLFSEGFPLIMGRQGKPLGEKRWMGLVKREAGFKSETFVRRVVATLEKFRGKKPLPSDTTLLTLGRPGG